MTGDALRWFGTMGMAGLMALLALGGTILLALHGQQIPEVLSSFDGLAGGAFFGIVGAMAGARASQNAVQISNGQGTGTAV
jgi:hypothetical protein